MESPRSPNLAKDSSFYCCRCSWKICCNKKRRWSSQLGMCPQGSFSLRSKWVNILLSVWFSSIFLLVSRWLASPVISCELFTLNLFPSHMCILHSVSLADLQTLLTSLLWKHKSDCTMVLFSSYLQDGVVVSLQRNLFEASSTEGLWLATVHSFVCNQGTIAVQKDGKHDDQSVACDNSSVFANIRKHRLASSWI